MVEILRIQIQSFQERFVTGLQHLTEEVLTFQARA